MGDAERVRRRRARRQVGEIIAIGRGAVLGVPARHLAIRLADEVVGHHVVDGALGSAPYSAGSGPSLARRARVGGAPQARLIAVPAKQERDFHLPPSEKAVPLSRLISLPSAIGWVSPTFVPPCMSAHGILRMASSVAAESPVMPFAAK